MNWKQLLAAVRTEGYEGKAEVAAVKAWLAENRITIRHGSKDLTADDIEAIASKGLTLTIDADPDSEPDRLRITNNLGEDDEPEEMAEDEPEEEKSASRRRDNARTYRRTTAGLGAPHVSTGSRGFASAAQRKRYNASMSNPMLCRSGHEQLGTPLGKYRAEFPDAEIAEAFAATVRLAATQGRLDSYEQKANDLAIVGKIMATTDIAAGGSFVDPEFQASLIEIFERFGAARQLAGVQPMRNHTLSVPRLGTDVTTNWEGETDSASASDPGTSQVSLVARKLMSLTRTSNEILNDSALSIADVLARSIGRSQASAEDDAYFNGTGASTYGAFTGVIPSLTGLGTNPEDAQGLSLASGDLWHEIDVDDIQGVFGLLRDFEGMDLKIACNIQFYWRVLVKFLDRAETFGGTAGTAVAASRGGSADPSSAPPRTFWGVPIVFAARMATLPATTAGRDTVPFLLGDFSMASKFGQVRDGMEIATSDQRYFDSDEFAVRGRNRVAINVHDVGSTTAAGPVVGLIMEDA